MTLSRLPLARAGATRSAEWAERSRAWLSGHREAAPAVAIVVAAVVAYHFTLGSLLDYLRLETPLAYLPLLPLFTLGIAVFTVQRYRDAPRPISDRQIDYLIGIPLLIAAFALISVVPVLASTYYWTNRPDVLSLALFVSALVILTYGITWFWRLRTSLLFLVLMWPALYLHIMAGLMQSFTDLTNHTLASVVAHLPLGVVVSSPGVLQLHDPHGQVLQVVIATACSGANSVLGFLLIGGALLTTQRRGLVRKLVWLAVGLLVTFAANLLRITSILALASAGHSSLALGAYHSVIGLVLFALVMLAMVLVMPRFGLQPKEAVKLRASRGAAATVEAAPNVRRRVIAAAALAAVTVVVAATDHGLAPYAAFEDGLGSPRVTAFSLASAPAGWYVSHEADYPWAQQYFGANSTFQRWTVYSTGRGLAYADIVRTDDHGSLDAYNLQNCFLFHNYSIVTSRRIDLGNGVTGLLLNYSDARLHAKWSTVSWAWPVNVKGDTYYERIALTRNLYGGSADADLQPSGGIRDFFVSLLNMLNGSFSSTSADTAYNKPDGDLQVSARALIARAVSRASDG